MEPANEVTQPMSNDTKLKPRDRRKAVPGTGIEDRPPRRRVVLQFAATLIVGMVLGAALMRLRYHAKEALFAINGSIIYEDYFQQRLEKAAGAQIAREIESEELFLQFAKQQGVAPTDADIDAKLTEDQKQPDYQQRLDENHQTEEDYRRGLAVKLAKTNLLTHGIKVSDTEVQQFYKHNIDQKNPNAVYFTPDTVQIEAIVTPTKSEGNKAIQALAKGNPFATVAQTYSQDVSSENGGLVPPIERGRTRWREVPGFENAIFGLKVGERLGPRQFAGAWWIIQCVDRIQANTQSFESVKEDALLGAKLIKGEPINSKKVQSQFEEFKKKAQILPFRPEFESAIQLNK